MLQAQAEESTARALNREFFGLRTNIADSSHREHTPAPSKRTPFRRPAQPADDTGACLQSGIRAGHRGPALIRESPESYGTRYSTTGTFASRSATPSRRAYGCSSPTAPLGFAITNCTRPCARWTR